MAASSTCSGLLASTLTPFLYPGLDAIWRAKRCSEGIVRVSHRAAAPPRRWQSSAATYPDAVHTNDSLRNKAPVNVNQYDHLDPSVPEYSETPFLDSCSLTLHSGAGGHGCISFLREKYIANGPANGGDGGTGGNVYIQAAQGETSLHKIARRGILKAGRGRNGQGGLQGGSRGEDILLTVPIGTVVREVWRRDPVAEEEALELEERRQRRRQKGFGRDLKDDAGEDAVDQEADRSKRWRRDKWLLYPGVLPSSFTSAEFPALPRPRRSNIATAQPPAPVRLDLDKPSTKPTLLAAGAMGGLGNPHFVTKSLGRPKFATKGDEGMSLHIQLELKLLADVGLVGLPNAGKSTLLRALTGSRARIGDWAFTTLSPNIGTVVLDDYRGRPALDAHDRHKERRTRFTIADIPGLVEDAHQDRGLGLGFLRHIERAAVLAFVIDLSAGDAVEALKGLWREVREYEKLRESEINSDSERGTTDAEGVVGIGKDGNSAFQNGLHELERASIVQNTDRKDLLLDPQAGRPLPPLTLPPISSKPWFVVATKADLEGTKEKFMGLQEYLSLVQSETEVHPIGKKNAWRKRLTAVPVSAMRKEGVSGIPELVVGLLQ